MSTLESLRIIINLKSYISNTNRDKDLKAIMEKSYQENQAPQVYFFTVVRILKLTQGIDRLHKLTVKFLKIKASIQFGPIKKVKYQCKGNIILHLVIIIHTPSSSMSRMKIIETIRFNLISNKIQISKLLHLNKDLFKSLVKDLVAAVNLDRDQCRMITLDISIKIAKIKLIFSIKVMAISKAVKYATINSKKQLIHQFRL